MSWSDETVLALMRKHRASDPTVAIQTFVRTQLDYGRQDRLPVDVEGLASLLGIKLRVDEYPFAGRIFAEPSGQLVMDLNAADISPRRRFTCAHEIIHTAFPGFVKGERYRSDSFTGSYTTRDEEEYLCDMGAALLLMPEHLIDGEYEIAEGLDAVERLARDAEVSLEAAANRLVLRAHGLCVLVVMELSHKPADRPKLRRGEAVEQRLRVRYGLSASDRVFIPKHKSAPDDSPFVRSLRSGVRESGVTYLPGAEKLGPMAIECGHYPYGDRERVIGIARPAR